MYIPRDAFEDAEKRLRGEALLKRQFGSATGTHKERVTRMEY